MADTLTAATSCPPATWPSAARAPRPARPGRRRARTPRRRRAHLVGHRARRAPCRRRRPRPPCRRRPDVDPDGHAGGHPRGVGRLLTSVSAGGLRSAAVQWGGTTTIVTGGAPRHRAGRRRGSRGPGAGGRHRPQRGRPARGRGRPRRQRPVRGCRRRRPRAPSPAAIARLEAELGPTDVMVANAGIGAYGAFADLAAEEAERLVRVNVLGTVHACVAVVPGMIERRRGTWSRSARSPGASVRRSRPSTPPSSSPGWDSPRRWPSSWTLRHRRLAREPGPGQTDFAAPGPPLRPGPALGRSPPRTWPAPSSGRSRRAGATRATCPGRSGRRWRSGTWCRPCSGGVRGAASPASWPRIGSCGEGARLRYPARPLGAPPGANTLLRNLASTPCALTCPTPSRCGPTGSSSGPG